MSEMSLAEANKLYQEMKKRLLKKGIHYVTEFSYQHNALMNKYFDKFMVTVNNNKMEHELIINIINCSHDLKAEIFRSNVTSGLNTILSNIDKTDMIIKQLEQALLVLSPTNNYYSKNLCDINEIESLSVENSSAIMNSATTVENPQVRIMTPDSVKDDINKYKKQLIELEKQKTYLNNETKIKIDLPDSVKIEFGI